MYLSSVLFYLAFSSAFAFDKASAEIHDNPKFRCIQESIISNMMMGRLQIYDNEKHEKLARQDLIECSDVISFILDVPVKDIEENAFADFHRLDNLEIRTNLSRLKRRHLKGLHSVSTLIVDSPVLESIDSGAFANMEDVKNMIISNSAAWDGIKYGVFNNLQLLDYLALDSNGIADVEQDSFSNLPNLERLSLRNNSLEEFSAPNLLKNTTGLLNLILSHNKIRFLKADAFKGLPELRYLDLAHNKISEMEDNILSDAQKLTTLDLSHNVLAKLSPESFSSSPLYNLKVIHVSFNRLYYLSPFFFSNLPNLSSVRLLGNPWKCECLDPVLEWLSSGAIGEECLQYYLEGDRPTCVVAKSGDTGCLKPTYYDEHYYNSFKVSLKNVNNDC